ncbi:MAG: hypothetical protein IJZ79_03625 [Bacilli bacterium]|nr:hypothetical protein [Bacilli bacterium]MBQ8218819.1 hypothetical protein [Bacilli bacterium]
MEKEVSDIILNTLLVHYGSDKVSEEDGNIYVIGDNGACEISIRYEE